ncbi:MAG: tetratricopeptide repeat protein [Bacteroidaceae bacterium]|nr:tetratricopeptide repeat protein [Bacteroidaceae bacterium]
METWIIYVATAVVILILGTLIQERIADKKTKKAAQNKPAEEPQPTAAVETDSIEQEMPATIRTGIEILKSFLKQNACTIEQSEEKDEWTYLSFCYQGGEFFAYGHNERDEVILYQNNMTLDYSPENFKWVQFICQKMTAGSLHVKLTHDYDNEQDQFRFTLQVGGAGAREEIIAYYLSLLFGAAQQLKMEFKQRDNHSYEEVVEQLRDRALFLRCQQYNEPMRIMAHYKHFNANCLTLSQALTSLYEAVPVEDMLSLTIVSEQGTEQISQRDKIASFDLFESIVKKNNGSIIASNIPVIITLDTTFFHYTLTLHFVEQTPNNIFIRLTAMKVQYDHLQKEMPDIVYTPESVSCLLCYETNDEHSFETFGRQMEVARQACRAGQELTDEQEQLIILTEGNLEYQLLEGRRLAKRSRYLQAIALLEPAYRRLIQKDQEIIESRYPKTVDAAYQLGYCYYHLNQMDKSYYYFGIAYKADRLDAAYMYFQLLYQTRDVNLLKELSEEKDKMEKILQDMAKRREQLDEDEERQYNNIRDYYLFLYKLHAEIMINQKFYDNAYSDLNYLLQYEQTHEYAQAKIDELDKIVPPEE